MRRPRPPSLPRGPRAPAHGAAPRPAPPRARPAAAAYPAAAAAAPPRPRAARRSPRGRRGPRRGRRSKSGRQRLQALAPAFELRPVGVGLARRFSSGSVGGGGWRLRNGRFRTCVGVRKAPRRLRRCLSRAASAGRGPSSERPKQPRRPRHWAPSKRADREAARRRPPHLQRPLRLSRLGALPPARLAGGRRTALLLRLSRGAAAAAASWSATRPFRSARCDRAPPRRAPGRWKVSESPRRGASVRLKDGGYQTVTARARPCPAHARPPGHRPRHRASRAHRSRVVLCQAAGARGYLCQEGLALLRAGAGGRRGARHQGGSMQGSALHLWCTRCTGAKTAS